MSTELKIAPAVKILVDRSAEIISAAGLTLEDFAGLTADKAREIINDCKAAAGMTDDSKLGETMPPKTQANKGNAESVDEVEYMGLPVEKRVYGTGRDRRVFQNAKAFEGSAYMNIYLPFGESRLKLGGINLQDLSEATPSDNGTKRGRATLVRLLKEHGIGPCDKIAFEVELNVAELMEHNTEELDAALAAYFQNAKTK